MGETQQIRRDTIDQCADKARAERDRWDLVLSGGGFGHHDRKVYESRRDVASRILGELIAMANGD